MLKKGIGILLTLLLLVSALPVGAEATTATEEKLAAEIKISEMFSAPASVDVNGKNGWSVSGEGLSAQQTVDPTNSSNHVLKLVGTASNTGTATKSFTEQTGKQKISLRLNAQSAASSSLKLTLCGIDVTLGLVSGIATVKAGTETMQGYYNDWDKVFVGAYPTNAWFELGVIVDADGKMDVFVDKNQVNSKKISGTAGVSAISFAIENAGTWYADDLKTASCNETAEETANAWQTICSEDMGSGLLVSGSAVRPGEQAATWRRNGIQYWTQAAGGSSAPTTTYMSARYREASGDGYLALERRSISGSGTADWPYYNFKPAWNTVRSLGGKVKVSFSIRSTSHSSSDVRPRYFGLADKDGNDVLKLWVKGSNLWWSSTANKWIGSLKNGQNLTLTVDYNAGKFTVHSGTAEIVGEGVGTFNTTSGAPAKVFFGLEPTVTTTGDTTQIDNIVVSQWNEYAVADLWTAGIGDDLEGNYADGIEFAKTSDWTPTGSVVWSVGGGVSAVKVEEGGSMQRTLGLQKGLVIFRAEVKSESGEQSITLKDYNNNATPNTLAAVTLKDGVLTAGGQEIANVGTDWFTLGIVLNTATGEYWLYNGETQLNETAVQGSASADVQYAIVSAASGTVMMKSFAVSAGSDTAAYTIRDVVMKQGSGEYVNRVGNGVTVQEIKIAKSRDAGAAKAIVAVYKDKGLVKVETADLAGTYSVGSVITLPLGFTVSEGEGDYSLKAFLWNDTETLQPLAAAYEDNRKTQILVAGDSIAQTYTWYWHYPMTGYGQTLEAYLDTDKVSVNNFGKSGTSTSTFESMGLFDNVLYAGRSGDYVTIQFAHNDQGQNISLDTYKANLKSFVTRAKAKGLNPIFITSPVRNPHASVATLGEYPTAMKAVATETGTPVVDLNTWSNETFGALTESQAALVYMHIKANDTRYFKKLDNGEYVDNYSDSQYNKSTATTDDTHFTVYGAHLLSKEIATQLSALENCGLSAYAKPEKTNPESFKVSEE